MERLLKGVSEKSWRDFKGEAAKHGMKMGEFLGYLVDEHKKTEHEKGAWDFIQKRERIITDAEAEVMKRAIEDFEKIEDFE